MLSTIEYNSFKICSEVIVASKCDPRARIEKKSGSALKLNLQKSFSKIREALL